MNDIIAPVQKPRRGRPPVRAAEVRPEPVREEIRKKVRVRKNAGMGQLHIPPEMIPEDIDLQWCTASILGQPTPNLLTQFTVNGWEQVTPEMFGGRFDGMFMPKGHKGEINVDGCVLMWRPLELTLEARAEDLAAARAAVSSQEARIQNNQMDGISFDTQHSSARRAAVLTKERIPSMAVPT